MSNQARILIFGHSDSQTEPIVQQLNEQYETVHPDNVEAALEALQNHEFSGLYLLGHPDTATGLLLDSGGILEQLPDGVVLLDPELKILWSNNRLREFTGYEGQIQGCSFYDVFGTPEILGPDFCPFSTALGSGETARSTLRVSEKSFFEVNVEPVTDPDADDIDLPRLLVVIVRDISEEVLQRQKLNAIYQAGIELGDISALEIVEMSVADRAELLKMKILSYTQDLLEFETVEIRLLDKRTKKLEPLISVGMEPVAVERDLLAEPENNGVTGFVAATGRSYLCDDTESDPLYLPGAPGARSSLTVPLILHDEVLGTFNVETPIAKSFDQNDLQFLELFSREVAVALNTLELLVAEKMTTASESTEKILREVAGPVDEILNDAAWILERYIGHEPNVCERLQKILSHTRDIKRTIQRVGESLAPDTSRTSLPSRPQRPKLRGKRILVVDEDTSVRQAAHELLGRYGCDVETAHNGEEAFLMVRSFQYDAVIADIRLPDMDGYACFCEIRKLHEELPVILMTGFGYDPSHSIVKARQAGLKSVLYKPFRLDQLLGELEKAVTTTEDMAETPK